jgi:hypothetical protein
MEIDSMGANCFVCGDRDKKSNMKAMEEFGFAHEECLDFVISKWKGEK